MSRRLEHFRLFSPSYLHFLLLLPCYCSSSSSPCASGSFSTELKSKKLKTYRSTLSCLFISHQSAQQSHSYINHHGNWLHEQYLLAGRIFPPVSSDLFSMSSQGRSELWCTVRTGRKEFPIWSGFFLWERSSLTSCLQSFLSWAPGGMGAPRPPPPPCPPPPHTPI